MAAKKPTTDQRLSDLEADYDEQQAENERLKERQIIAAQVLSGDIELVDVEDEEDEEGEDEEDD